MKDSKKKTVRTAGNEPAEWPLCTDKGGQGEAVSPGEVVSIPAELPAKSSPAIPDEETLARSLEELDALPEKFSRSYLLPYTKHLLLLRQKGYSYRYMLKWLFEEHGISSNLSTLSHFLKRATREQRRLKRVQAESPALPPTAQISVSTAPQHSGPDKPLHGETPVNAQAREAIRAVKNKSKETKQSIKKKSFTFKEDQPLISNPKTKSN